MTSYLHFYELPVYKCCRNFRIRISEIIRNSFPKKEDFLLANQLLRSSRSVTANVAEGFGRFHHQENIQFCRQARGSLTESIEHLITAYDEKYITEEILISLKNEYAICLKELNSYIKYLKVAKQNNQ